MTKTTQSQSISGRKLSATVGISERNSHRRLNAAVDVLERWEGDIQNATEVTNQLNILYIQHYLSITLSNSP